MIRSMQPSELAEVLADESLPVQLVDVRERQEVEIVALPQFWVMPMSESREWVDRVLTQFDHDRQTIVMCHHGIRSLHLCQWLEAQGFTDLYNLSGGIDAYAVQVDRSTVSGQHGSFLLRDLTNQLAAHAIENLDDRGARVDIDLEAQ